MSAAVRPLLSTIASPGTLVRVAFVLLGTIVLTISARLEIPLPFSPVPVTGQTLAVLLIGAAAGARLGAITVATYLVEGLAGLPVYAGGASGIARAVGPTGGYLVGFVLAAAVVGWAAQRGWTRDVPRTLLTMLAGEIAIYVCGLAWLARFPLPVGVLEAGLFPFVAGDLYKIALAIVLLPPATRAIAGRDRGVQSALP